MKTLNKDATIDIAILLGIKKTMQVRVIHKPSVCSEDQPGNKVVFKKATTKITLCITFAFCEY